MRETRSLLPEQDRITSWKAIADFLGRDARTVQRWEKARQLPVHRATDDPRVVFAYKAELQTWLNSASPYVLTERIPDSPSVSFGTDEADPPSANGSELPNSAQYRLHPAPSHGALWNRVYFWLAAAALATLLFFADVYHARIEAASGRHLEASRNAETASSAGPTSPTTQAQVQSRELYLHGLYHWSRRTPDSLEQALHDFTQAIVLDPANGRAYAGLAATYELMPQFSRMPLTDAFPRAVTAAQRAVTLEPNSSEAHRVLAFGLFYWEWQIPQAEAEFRRAIELAPDDPETHHWFANALLTVRDFPRAEAEMQRARELNPGSRAILADQVLLEATANGNYEDGVRKLRELEQTEPDFLSPPRYLTIFALQHGDAAVWVKEMNRAASLSHDPAETARAEAARRGYMAGGRTGALQSLRKVHEAQFENGQSTGFELGLACMRLGDMDAAAHYLEAAHAAHDYRLLTLVNSPLEQPLRGNAAYERLRQSLVQSIGSGAQG